MLETVAAVLLAVGLDRLTAARPLIDPLVWYRSWAEALAQRLDGSRSHGILAAAIALLPVALIVVVVRHALAQFGWVLRFGFDVIVLAWCLDLYRLVDRAQEVADALKIGDMPVANENLRLLNGRGAATLSETGIARATIEIVLEQCNAVVVAPVFWFMLLGPVGAAVQRTAALLAQLWTQRGDEAHEFGHAVMRLNEAITWIPARITAISYAIMGNFEDALRCWRYQAGVWSDSNHATLLASGFGAMQLQSCEGVADSEGSRAEVAVASVAPDAGHVARVVGLLWRVLLFWLGIAILIIAAHYVQK
jgi:adenosylcobinamide-phosphate synthase